MHVPQPPHPLHALTSGELAGYQAQLEHALRTAPDGDPARPVLRRQLDDVLAEQDSRARITASGGQPARDELTPRVFRALYAEYELRAVEGTRYVAVPKGTAWHAGQEIGEIAEQISARGHRDPVTAALDTPARAPLPPRPVPVPAPAVGRAARPRASVVGERTA
jgi:hypothetical protein